MNKKKLELKSEPARSVGLEWPPEIESQIKENCKIFFQNLKKLQSNKWLLLKEKTIMKKTKWQSIDIKQEVYNKLEAYRCEWSADNLSDVINNFILYFEQDQEQEDDRYYCENCGDYHD